MVLSEEAGQSAQRRRSLGRLAVGVGLTATAMLLLSALAVGYRQGTDDDEAEARCRQVSEAQWMECYEEEAVRSPRDVAAPLVWGATGAAALVVLGAALDRRKVMRASAAGAVAAVAVVWIALGLLG